MEGRYRRGGRSVGGNVFLSDLYTFESKQNPDHYYRLSQHKWICVVSLSNTIISGKVSCLFSARFYLCNGCVSLFHHSLIMCSFVVSTTAEKSIWCLMAATSISGHTEVFEFHGLEANT